MILPAISASTLLSSAMVIAVPATVASESSALVESGAQSNMLEAEAPISRLGPVASGLTLEASDVEHWSAEKNARFKELGRKEAIGELSIEELAELETLTRLRRYAKYPRSADEILWQRRQQTLTRSLVQALHAYVEFHETSRST